MYDIAATVAACLRSNTRVDVAWAVETRGFSSRDRREALALMPGGERVGSVASGALDEPLAGLVERGLSGRLVDLQVGDVEAMAAGLSCGGDARCLLVPATDLPVDLWTRLADREAVCLVALLDGDSVTSIRGYDRATVAEAGAEAEELFSRGVSDTRVLENRVITAMWPVPTLVIVGAGTIAQALEANADLLRWRTRTATDPPTATALIDDLTVLDMVVVLSHDQALAGPALAAALAGRVGYIGALGSRHTQEARADWLAERGITDLHRIYGPAGLDIGAHAPPEIAVSVIAEALAVNAGRSVGSLRDRAGAIHARSR